MAHAEALRIIHSIRNEVKVVDSKVEQMGDKVQCVDDKVQLVIDGARGLSNQLKPFPSNNYPFRWKGSGKGHR